MRACLFEDRGVNSLEPLSLTRPAFDLWCGMMPLHERQCRHLLIRDWGALVRPMLIELCRLGHPSWPINDLAWLRASPTVMINARWLPPTGVAPPLDTPHVGLVGDQVAYAVLPPDRLTYCSSNTLDDCVESWKNTLPQHIAGGWMMTFPWDLIERNGETLCHDFERHGSVEDRPHCSANLTVVGPSDLVLADPSAQIEPFTVADTTRGPVIIDRDAVVQAFSRLEGPCYIGPRTQVLGGKIRGATIGPNCRIGGEVEASIVHGHSNKYHDGFLGHSCVGEWVNLAAGTQVSDLRNDYGPVPMTINGRRIETGLTKIGSFIGDHTKTGLGTLFNTGSVVGAFCNVLPAGRMAPKVIPSFCTFANGQLQEEGDVAGLLATAATVMQRRGHELTTVHAAFFRALNEQTTASRRQIVRDREQRRLRLSA